MAAPDLSPYPFRKQVSLVSSNKQVSLPRVTGAGRRPETPGSEIKDVTHSKAAAEQQHFIVKFHCGPVPTGRCGEGQAPSACAVACIITGEEPQV